MGAPMFIAVLVTVAKIWKQSKCLSMDKWIKMWYIYIYTMEYCSAMRKKELLPFGTTWTNLEGVMFSETIQIEKDKHCMISLCVESKKAELIKIEWGSWGSAADHGVLKAWLLKWFSIPFSSGPHFVRTLHHDPSILGDPTRHGS